LDSSEFVEDFCTWKDNPHYRRFIFDSALAETAGDPVFLDPAELARRGIRRLPQTLPEAAGHLEQSHVLRQAMGEPLFEAVLAVRRGEAELFAGRSPEEIVARTRWRW